MIFCIILTQSYINFSRREHQKDVLHVSLRFHPIPPFIFPLQSLQKRAVLTRSHIWKSRFNSVFTSLIEPKLITRCPNVDFLIICLKLLQINSSLIKVLKVQIDHNYNYLSLNSIDYFVVFLFPFCDFL